MVSRISARTQAPNSPLEGFNEQPLLGEDEERDSAFR